MNCLSITGGDEVSVIRAERQAVDVDEPEWGIGRGEQDSSLAPRTYMYICVPSTCTVLVILGSSLGPFPDFQCTKKLEVDLESGDETIAIIHVVYMYMYVQCHECMYYGIYMYMYMHRAP